MYILTTIILTVWLCFGVYLLFTSKESENSIDKEFKILGGFFIVFISSILLYVNTFSFEEETKNQVCFDRKQIEILPTTNEEE